MRYMASGTEATYVGAQDLGAEIRAPHKRALAAPSWQREYEWLRAKQLLEPYQNTPMTS